MKLADVPEGSRFLDVDSIPVEMQPDRTCIAFEERGSPESRPYGSPSKAGVEGDDLSREEFSAWLETGRNGFDMPAKPEPSAQATMREIPGISPEARAQMDEFSRKLGEALVANLNQATNPDSGTAT